MNYLIVKRYVGEKASILCSCEQNKRKYNLRAIDYSLLNGIMDEDIICNNKLTSNYPAVTNIICFELENYFRTLITTNTKLPEYIFHNSEGNSFRLETVLQDYILLADKNCKIYSLYMSRWLCFNPVKDIANINNFYTPADGEKKYYAKNKKKLTKLGWNIGENVAIHIDPLISSTIESTKTHFNGVMDIGNNSKLVIEGNVFISNLYLNGSLVIKVKNAGCLKANNIIVKNAGIEFRNSNNEYYSRKIYAKGEAILEYGDKVYNVERIDI